MINLVTRFIFTSSVLLIQTGCFVTEKDHQKALGEVNILKAQVEKLVTNLGAFQYHGLDPELKFSLSGIEFKNGVTAVSSPEVKFRCSLKQINQSFPLEKYELQIEFVVIAPDGSEFSEIDVSASVENGVLSLAETETMWGKKGKYEWAGYQLQVKSYTWYPISKFTPTRG